MDSLKKLQNFTRVSQESLQRKKEERKEDKLSNKRKDMCLSFVLQSKSLAVLGSCLYIVDFLLSCSFLTLSQESLQRKKEKRGKT